MDTRWLYVTSAEFPALRELAKQTCVIPIGCVEKHSLHLPLGQDILQVSHIAHEASKLEPVCVFPDFAFGDISGGTNPDMGFIEMPLELRNDMLGHFCKEISRNGFKKIIIFTKKSLHRWQESDKLPPHPDNGKMQIRRSSVAERMTVNH